MPHLLARDGLRESWEEYRDRHQHVSPETRASMRAVWLAEGRRLLNWAGPGTPCPTSNGVCVIETETESEARYSAS